MVNGTVCCTMVNKNFRPNISLADSENIDQGNEVWDFADENGFDFENENPEETTQLEAQDKVSLWLISSAELDGLTRTDTGSQYHEHADSLYESWL
jgi:hypothetical protein